jgi:molecular chaperone HscB
MLDFSKNHFELFGLPQRYRVDLDALTARYRDLQRVVHPDRYAGAGDQEKRLSMQGAVRINEAFQVLKDPIRRARYMLSLRGLDPEAGPDTNRDAAFLMEQMELREELEAARSVADPLAAVDALMTRLDGQIRSLAGQLADQLDEPSPAGSSAALELVHKMQFLQKLRQEAEALEADLEEAL